MIRWVHARERRLTMLVEHVRVVPLESLRARLQLLSLRQLDELGVVERVVALPVAPVALERG